MFDANAINLKEAAQYRKRPTVVAFHMSSGATYAKEASWGSDQEFPGAHYAIVGAVESGDFEGGRRIATHDVYGCAVDEFENTYVAAENDGEYRKTSTINAKQITQPFTVTTTTSDGNVEVAAAEGNAGDWVALGVKGERYMIPRDEFEDLYVTA